MKWVKDLDFWWRDVGEIDIKEREFNHETKKERHQIFWAIFDAFFVDKKRKRYFYG